MKTTTLFVMVLFFVLITSVSATWCDTDFAKRINVSVNNTGGGALSDYQVYVNLSVNPINETSLRVYNATSCTLRSHWTENETGGNSYGVWINYSSIAASAWTNNTAIYYDNVAASSTNNGDNTFEFFDDFDDIAQIKGTYTKLTDITVAKEQHGFEECDGILYAVCGANGTGVLNSTYAYNITTDTWTQKADAPASVQSPALRAVNGKLYLIGGLDNTDGYVKKGTYEYNPVTNVWTQKADMPTAREDMASAVVNNKIYVIGGLYQGGGSAYKVGDVEVYDPSTNTWDDTIGDMPDLRCLGDFGASYNGVIYLVSACTSYPTGYPALTSSVRVDAYNVTTDTWTQKAGMPRPRSYKEVEEVGGKLWVVGGSTTSAHVSVAYVDIYDIANNTWKQGTDYPLSRSGLGMAEYDGTIYCSGGKLTTTGSSTSKDFYKLNPLGVITDSTLDTDKWAITHSSGTHNITDSIITLSGNAGNSIYSITSKTGFSPNAILRMKSKFEATAALYQVTQGGWGPVTGFALSKDENTIASATGNPFIACGDGTNHHKTSIASSNLGDWYIYDIVRLGTSTELYKNDVLVDTCQYDSNSNRYPSLRVRDSEYKLYSDWVLVRKYASTEPSTTLGNEEQQGANPTLHIGNTINIKEDWGRDFNSNLSANVTSANASNVWMNFSNAEFTNTSLGDINLTLNEWVNESHNVNAPATNVSVTVFLNAPGATNDTDSFWYEITKRTNTATMDSAATQSVDISETFYVNATCNEEYSNTFYGAATLLEDGAIIATDTSVTNYVNFSHSESSAGQYNYTVRFYNLTHYDNATTATCSNVTVSMGNYIPPDPTNLQNITGNFWVNHTWIKGTLGNVTDSYNVHVYHTKIPHSVWHNGTTNTSLNNTQLGAHGWSNATIWAFNSSGSGTLSPGNVSEIVNVPNNVPVLSGLPDNTTTEDVNQMDIFDLDAYFTDADSDTPTYLVESNNQSAHVSVTINASNNVSYTLASGWNGTASVVINATDGWGGEDSDTFLIIVNAAPLPSDYVPGNPTNLQNTTGNYWVNYTWDIGSGNVTDSYNVSWNLTWFNNTLTTYMQKDVGASNWGNITVYAFNSSGNGTLSTGSISDNVQAPAHIHGDYPPATPTTLGNTTGNGWVHYTWSSGGGANVTDSYNVSWNLTWYNNTLVAYMNDTVGEFGWANITVFAFNLSGNGSLSVGSISDETQAEGGTYTTPMGTTAYNLITYYSSTTSTAEQFGIDIGSVDYIAMYNGSFHTHTMGFSANNFTTYHGIGYYIYLNASGSSTYERNNIPDVPYNTQLFNRWNTIGWTNSTDTNAEGIATSIGSACKYTSMLNADGVTYTTHTVGFTSNNHAAEKGKGYWVWTNTGLSWSRNN